MKSRCLVYLIILVLFNISSAQADKKTAEYEGERVIVARYDNRIKPARKFLRAKAAKDYIGNLKSKVTSGNYTAQALIRKARSERYLNIYDGVVFNSEGGKFGYVNRKDGDVIIILDYAHGTKADTVTPDNFNGLEITINDDCPASYVFFDQHGNEAAIVYLPPKMRIDEKFNRDGLVVFKIYEPAP